MSLNESDKENDKKRSHKNTLHSCDVRASLPQVPEEPRAATANTTRWGHLSMQGTSRAQPCPLCSTHESWVKSDSTQTQMSRVRVESAWKKYILSRVRVESGPWEMSQSRIRVKNLSRTQPWLLHQRFFMETFRFNEGIIELFTIRYSYCILYLDNGSRCRYLSFLLDMLGLQSFALSRPQPGRL